MAMALTSIAERTKRCGLGAVLLWAALLGGPQPQAAPAEVVIRFSHVVAQDTPKGQMVQRLAELVAQRAGGRMRVDIFPDSELYGDEDEMEALRLGAVEMLAPSLSKFGNVGLPEFEVFDLPYLFSDTQQVQRVMQGPVGQRLLAKLERQQMVGLGFLDNGFKQMSARKPLRTPTDFKGLRLRVQSSAVLVAQMQALGAQAVALPFGETRRALANGVVDGTENPLSNFLTQGLATVQPHVTLTQHGYLGYLVVTNPRFWASLKPADRELLRQCLQEALAFGNRQSAEMNQQAQSHLARMPGLQLHSLTVAERAALRQAAQPAYAAFERSVEPAFMRDVRRALDAN
jgi:C4-dicarboxylate-binding protein DctP